MPHVLICSLREDLVNVVSRRRKMGFVVHWPWNRLERLLERQLTGAVSCHMDDVFSVREWSRVHRDCLVVVVRRVPLPHAWPPIFSVAGCAINQSCIDVQEMNPNFVVAGPVWNLGAKCFVRDFERTVHANMPLSFGTRWLDAPTMVYGHVELAGSCWQRSPQQCCCAAVHCLIDVAMRHHRSRQPPRQPVLDALQYRLQVTSFSPIPRFLA